MYKKLLLVFILLFCFSISNVKADSLDCGVTLRRGSSGSNVKKLQKRLNEVMDCDLDVDGVFGRMTYSCVVKFEKKYGLDPDGIVGKKTCSKLNKELDDEDNDEEISLSDGNYLIVIDEDGSNIYSSKSSSSNVIKRAEFGELFNYVSYTSRWYKIDLGDSYGYIKRTKVKTSFILVDISDQRLQYIKNNKVVVDTNVVTGMMGSHDTPVGYYIIREYNKERERTLKGTNDNGSSYSAYVEYWMPFITSRGIGFHDASWRSSEEFNDSTYIYDGSHGCVNMPSNEARSLYKAITDDEDVIIRD